MPNLRIWKTQPIKKAIKRFNKTVVKTAKVVAEINDQENNLESNQYLSTIDDLYPLRYNREDFHYPVNDLDELEVVSVDTLTGERIPGLHLDIQPLKAK